jgi:hypothetical protein
MKRNVFGIGCDVHIVPKCVQSGCGTPSADAEALVVKMYKYFTVSVRALQRLCDGAATKYRTHLQHGCTRYLSLLPAVGTLNLNA